MKKGGGNVSGAVAQKDIKELRFITSGKDENPPPCDGRG
jgi:hypothetical protein